MLNCKKSGMLFIVMMLPAEGYSLGGNHVLIESAKKDASSSVSIMPWDAIPVDVALSEWKLSGNEWNRYKALMQGRARYYASEMPPPMVLAMFADTDDERNRFVDKLVEYERDRMARLTAVQDAYDVAYKRLYPDEKILDFDKLRAKGLMSKNTESIIPQQDARIPRVGDRIALFASSDCTSECVRKMDILTTRHAIAPLEVYFKGSDTEFRQWIVAVGLDKKSVSEKHITFARDEGQSEQFKALPGTAFIVREKNLYEIAL